MTEELIKKGEAAKEAAFSLATVSTDMKNKALEQIADALVKNSKIILEANEMDLENAEKNEVPEE